ncbi:MAG: TetR/AcrR family transcriptional regulator [Nannocystaceae bacterium]|nr:TetR/AcrR family transcriptional regulator [Nannocystaceae bacterium]
MGRPALSPAGISAFRERAVGVALRLFTTQSEVSLRQLAKAMGVSPTTPYRYFQSKEELFMAVRATCYHRFASVLETRLAAIGDPIDRVFEISAVYDGHASEHPAEFGLMFQLGQPDPQAYPRAHAAGVATWQVVMGAVEDAVLSGRVHADAEHLAHLLWSGVHGIVSLSQSNRFTVGQSAQDLLRPMTAALLRAHGWTP